MGWAGGLRGKEPGRLPRPGERASVSGLVLEAERTEGRRKRISTILVEADQALIDAHAAFDGGETVERNHRD